MNNGNGIKTWNDYNAVYLLTESSGATKIGVSSKPQGRIEAFRTNIPRFITEFKFWYVPEAYELESRFHKHFSDKRLNGEWFDLDVDDFFLIEEVINKWKRKLCEKIDVMAERRLFEIDIREAPSIVPELPKDFDVEYNTSSKNKKEEQEISCPF